MLNNMELIEVFLPKNEIIHQYEEKIFITNTYGFFLVVVNNKCTYVGSFVVIV